MNPLRQFWENFGSLIVAVAIALGIRTFVIEPFRIPSESMLPTLLIGDHLFVNKFVYGPKIPFTDARLPGLREPERGDVVVFTVARERSGRIVPVDQGAGVRTEEFVKRIVGLPGDTVEVSADGIRINGEPVTSEDLGRDFTDEDGRELAMHQEELGQCPHQVLDNRDTRGTLGSWKVPEGRYLMMGDNRDYSNDGRSWGTVRASEFKGPALVLYWSWDYNGGWLELLNPLTWWNAEKRWDRFGDSLHCNLDED